MPDNPILISKKGFLEQVLQKSQTSSFDDEMIDSGIPKTKLPKVVVNSGATISNIQEE